jgi:VanZ family protein
LTVYIGLIFYLSSRPYGSPVSAIPHADKVLHVAEYGVLGYLSQRATRLSWPAVGRGSTLARLALVLAGGLCIAAIDEVLQSRVPHRIASARDLLADAIGLGLGLVLNLRPSLRENRRVAEAKS